MKHIVFQRPGGYDQISIQESPDLHPKQDKVVVNVEYAGMSYGECIVRMGLYKSAKMHGYPITPGFEFAGTISEIGDGVSRFTVGQRVFGVSWFGAYTTQVCVPALQLFPIPKELTTVQAATFPAVFLTAWYGAIKLVQASKGMITLVHSAAGGVGMALVQILKANGCRVVGVVGSSKKVETAKNADCDEVIDKSIEPLWPAAKKYAPGGYDLVFDSNGVSTMMQGYKHLAPTGKLITYGFASMLPRSGRLNFISLAIKFFRSPRFNPIRMAEDNKSVMAFNLSFLFDHRELLAEGMATLMEMLHNGNIKPLPVTEYAFTDYEKALRAIESGGTTGKLALRI